MNDSKNFVPAFCPICEGMMKGLSTKSFYDFGCCSICFVFFVEGRESKWQEGWRPSKQEIETMYERLSGAS